MKKKAFIVLLVISTLVVSFVVIKKIDDTPRTDDAYAYANTINVVSQVSGMIIYIPVKDNQLVKKGDVLFQIDPQPYQDALNRAEASLAQLEQQIILTQRNVNAQKFNALAAEKKVNAAQATAEQNTNTLRRLEILRTKNFVSKESLDQAKATQRSSNAQLQAAQLEAEESNASISSVAALQAQKKVLKADISTAEFNLRNTIVKAPFDGRVVSLNTSNGQYADVGKPIFTLIDSRQWYVIANFRESELENIKNNINVDIYLMSNTRKVFSGVVESVGYGVSPDEGGAAQNGLPKVSRNINWVHVAQRFPVRVRVLNPDVELFRIGTSAVVSVHSYSY